MHPSPLTVWYDGACPLCTREIALMRRLDRARRIEFVDVSDDGATCPRDRTLLLARIPVVLSALEWAYVQFLRVRPAIQRMMR